ncbi:MAG: sigma-54 dependent transcriptional regulator [Chromatiales bacterium]|jgi:two-component system response regulator PilR (NtrC family)
MSRPLALIVDDEPDIRELLEITLGRMNVATRSAADLAEARGWLERGRFDLCLTDMRLPDGDGIELVELISTRRPELPVAVITAHGNMEAAIQAMKAGAFDFVSKPVDLQVLRGLVETALRLGSERPAAPADVAPAGAGGPRLLGGSPEMARIRTMIAKLARSQAPVYISGESGTGKELAARLIHLQGPRAAGSFVPVNCGAIPQELMESELFGHRRGSFTGAVTDKEGLFQAADGGTLFLDEVADLPLPMQVKLLRAIQERSVRAVGAARETRVDTRIISATHQDLPALVKAGRFRQDLFYRLDVIDLHMPALRERPGDIQELADDILARLAADADIAKPAIRADAMERLAGYGFPGNVRELENILERAITLCERDCIRAADLRLPADDAAAGEDRLDLPLEDYLSELERRAILEALEATRWNRTAAARRLGISFRALRYRLAKLGLDGD